MSSFSKRLKELREERGLSLQDVADKCGISKSSIHLYEIGKRNPKQNALEELSCLFNVDIDYLLGRTDIKNSAANALGFNSLEEAYSNDISPIARPIIRKRIPMLGNVACGEPIFAEEDHNAYVDADANTDADFCLTAQGDSMINARIFDGDILFVKQQDSVEDGEIAVVLIEDEATVKRVYYDKENNILTLVPENPTHKPMRFTGSQLEQIRILGKVIAGQYNI